jgi:hypothetical protein
MYIYTYICIHIYIYIHYSYTSHAHRACFVLQGSAKRIDPVQMVHSNIEGGDGIQTRRHTFASILVHGGTMHLATYNYHPSSVRKLSEGIGQIVDWMLSRQHFLDRVLLAKAGLFRRLDVVAAPYSSVDRLGTRTVQQVVVTSQDDILAIVDSQCKTPRSKLKLVTLPDTNGPRDTLLLALRGRRPQKPLQTTDLRNEPDPVRRHGMQLEGILRNRQDEQKKRSTVYRLYQAWEAQTRKKTRSPTPLANAIPEVEGIKKIMRPTHYCSTPIHFLPHPVDQVCGCPASEINYGHPYSLTNHPIFSPTQTCNMCNRDHTLGVGANVGGGGGVVSAAPSRPESPLTSSFHVVSRRDLERAPLERAPLPALETTASSPLLSSWSVDTQDVCIRPDEALWYLQVCVCVCISVCV